MYCSRCGKDNPRTAAYCNACGNPLFYKSPMVSGTVNRIPQPGANLKKTSVLFMIFMTVITGGIYWAIWFLTRKDAINRLQSREKLSTGVLVFVTVMVSMSLVAGVISGGLEGLGETEIVENLDAFGGLLDLITGITLLVQCFKVRRILKEHLNMYLRRGIPFSGAATFFFGIFYLQYKINRL